MGENERNLGLTEQEENNGAGLSVEESFAQLKEILTRMDSEEITLEESLALYERGIALVRHCAQSIDRVEKKVQQLMEDGELHEF
ncbi:MAG: exodeoxyribonuclease VII small subunit [Lachnospiraceae bacterium]|nr:exodeoxyribonuclease VII small subunit [Lachnospiraceae bacterium]